MGERGATLFVVVLVMTLLLGIGAFAARSAHLSTASSGYERHQTQSRYVAEYGLMMATSLLGSDKAQSYMRYLSNPALVAALAGGSATADVCQGQSLMKTPTCYKMNHAELQGMVSTGSAGFNLCDDATATNVGSLGALGRAQRKCSWMVELTDKVQGTTPSGFDTAGGKALFFFYVTATATGQVLLDASNASVKQAGAMESSGTQTVRGRILAGPFPVQ